MPRLALQRYRRIPEPHEGVQVTFTNCEQVARWVHTSGLWAEASKWKGGGVHLESRDPGDGYAVPGQYILRVGQREFQVWDADKFEAIHECLGLVDDEDQLALWEPGYQPR